MLLLTTKFWKSTCFALVGVILIWGNALAQSTTGAFLVGEQDLAFTDNGLQTPNVNTHCWYPGATSGTAAAVAAGTFPVIAFGHGFNLNYLDYSQICAHLASWGYIVISPNVQNGFNVDHLEFAKELAACLSYVQSEGANNSSAFFQHVDVQTGVIGHSMGGGASALVPGVYPGIDAVCGLAAAETTPSAITALASYSGPYQVISGSSDNTAPENTNQTPMYNAATGTKQWVSITGGAHCKFTDGSTVCDFVSSAGSVTRALQVRLAKRYATAFFNYHLKSDPTALTFLCGDSLQADISGSVVTSQTTHTCAVGLSTQLETVPCWQVSPNPFSGNLKVQGSGIFAIHNSLGQVVAKGAAVDGKAELNLSALPSGIYFLTGEERGCRQVLVRE